MIYAAFLPHGILLSTVVADIYTCEAHAFGPSPFAGFPGNAQAPTIQQAIVAPLKIGGRSMASIEEMKDAAYPMYFGVSCAFAALHVMSRKKRLDLECVNWSRVGELMLQGSAQLLGLLVDRAQRREEAIVEKLKKAELEVSELKLRRAEDAKANEKVVSIFAAQEQSWIARRKKLGLQIQALMNELQNVKAKNEENIMELNKRIDEEESVIQVKDAALQEEAKKRRDLEEKLGMAQEVAEELRERAKKAAQDHSAELLKHKTAFVELVSSQRQLEAQLGRALLQVEASKKEIEEVSKCREEAVAMVEKLSAELIKIQKDAEQKDKILSALLRKSKLDTAERQMLLKELKMAKAKKKQTELDMERWMNSRKWRHRKGPRAKHDVEAGCSQEQSAELQLATSKGCNPQTLLLEYLEAESRKEQEAKGGEITTTSDCFDHYSSEGSDELAYIDDIQQLKEWVRMETEKYASILEQRHYEEIEAFTEQMRLKDEQLQALNWQLLSVELELKRLQTHGEGLDGNLSHFREENFKLEGLLMEREKELRSLKEKFNFHLQLCQRSTSPTNLQDLWSEVKITKRKPKEKEQETKAKLVIDSQQTDKKAGTEDIVKETKLTLLKPHNYEELMCRERMVTDITISSLIHETPPTNPCEDHAIVCVNERSFGELEETENLSRDQPKSIIRITQDLKDQTEEEKVVDIDPIHVEMHNYFRKDTDTTNKFSSTGKSFLRMDSAGKMDIHALGVSYKIKRLKQQLLVLENLVAVQATEQTPSGDDAYNVENCSDKRTFDENSKQMKGFLAVMSLLNKQVQRYQSLEEKIDDLCRRMQENSRTGSRDSQSTRTKEQTEALQGFLEETFQLQRFMVATGQKLMEVQSRIASCCVYGDGLGESAGFNMRQFADVIRTLCREIQRGLEVRIARIIGDIEGKLACDGILR